MDKRRIIARFVIDTAREAGWLLVPMDGGGIDYALPPGLERFDVVARRRSVNSFTRAFSKNVYEIAALLRQEAGEGAQ